MHKTQGSDAVERRGSSTSTHPDCRGRRRGQTDTQTHRQEDFSDRPTKVYAFN